ncbi:MAG: hypothetical protein C4543_11175 [Ignavibacteriales bacterium]|nr:MAG: hypothetical protein C4543_11175 [Ignavibacteriales bacterium]
MDYLNNKNYEYKIEKYLEKINKTGVKSSISLKYFINNIVEPDKSLIGYFNEINLFDVYQYNMLDIFKIVREFAKGNIVVITEWTVPWEGDSSYSEFIKNVHGESIPAYPYPKVRENWMPKEQPYKVYYYDIHLDMYNSDSELAGFLEEFRGFDTYSGYIIDAHKMDIFKKFLLQGDIDISIEKEFRDSIIGFFSGVHECDTLVIISK